MPVQKEGMTGGGEEKKKKREKKEKNVLGAYPLLIKRAIAPSVISSLASKGGGRKKEKRKKRGKENILTSPDHAVLIAYEKYSR